MIVFWFVFLAILPMGMAITKDECPSDLERDSNLRVYDDSCFRFVLDHSLEYDRAEQDCERDGGTLALVKTSRINAYLTNLLVNDFKYSGHVFFGLKDKNEEGIYTWEDGTTLGLWRNWAPGSGPSRQYFSFWGRTYCMALDSTLNGMWVDERCTSMFYGIRKSYICQYKVTNSSAHIEKGKNVAVENCPATVRKDKRLQIFGNSCFRFELGVTSDYKQAEISCEEDGGTLAIVKSAELSTFLTDTLIKMFQFQGRIFIGLNDDDTEDEYMWEDGTPLRNSTFINWADGSGPGRYKADQELRDCVTLDTNENGKWVDEYCYSTAIFRGSERPFVCQYPIVNAELSTSASITKSQKHPNTTDKVTTLVGSTDEVTKLESSTKEVTQSSSIAEKVTNKERTTQITTTIATDKPTTSAPTAKINSTSPTSSETTMKTSTAADTSDLSQPPKPTSMTSSINLTETSRTTTTPQPTCPPFSCSLDCRMNGYKTNTITGCVICQCDV